MVVAIQVEQERVCEGGEQQQQQLLEPLSPEVGNVPFISIFGCVLSIYLHGCHAKVLSPCAHIHVGKFVCWYHVHH